MDRLFFSANMLAEEAAEPHLGWGVFAYVVMVWVVIATFLFYAKKGLNATVFKSKPTQWAEQAYLFIEAMCLNVIGAHGRKYVPMMFTFWLIIFVSNLLGLILPHTPSADWSLNLGMAIIVVLYVQWEGILGHYEHDKAHGKSPALAAVTAPFKHLLHFSGPRLAWYLIPVSALLFCIEIVSETLRILTLSLRLYGNIHGGHQVRSTLDHMISPVHLGSGSVTIPLGMLILPLEFLVAIVQALVFTILACVYLSIVTNHEEDDHGDAHAPATSAVAAH